MNTKICTSIEQSKKLLSLGLDPSTADMYYKYVLPKSDKFHHVPNVGEPTNALDWYNKGYTLNGRNEPLELKEFCIPCWSLTTLLAALPNEIITDDRFECHYQIHIRKYDGGDNTTLYQIAYGNNRGSSGSWHDMINTGEKESLIDCCVEMIFSLHKNNML